MLCHLAYIHTIHFPPYQGAPPPSARLCTKIPVASADYPWGSRIAIVGNRILMPLEDAPLDDRYGGTPFDCASNPLHELRDLDHRDKPIFLKNGITAVLHPQPQYSTLCRSSTRRFIGPSIFKRSTVVPTCRPSGPEAPSD